MTDHANPEHVAEIRCPLLDCGHVIRSGWSPPEPEPGTLTSLLAAAGGLDTVSERQRLEWIEAIEGDFADHLDSHDHTDWIATLRAQQQALVRAEDLNTELRRQLRARELRNPLSEPLRVVEGEGR